MLNKTLNQGERTYNFDMDLQNNLTSFRPINK